MLKGGLCCYEEMGVLIKCCGKIMIQISIKESPMKRYRLNHKGSITKGRHNAGPHFTLISWYNFYYFAALLSASVNFFFNSLYLSISFCLA